jgi:uncharacterized membrane protein
MRTFYLVVTWLHVVAAMIWIGGMVICSLAVMPAARPLAEPQRAAFLYTFIGYFRRVMWPSLAVLAMTGLLSLWMRGVRLEDFLNAEWRASWWARLLTLKITLVIATTAAALAHERVRRPRHARWLGRLTLTLGLVIVALAVLLVRGM